MENREQSEIIIKITPQNLERLIYILVILALLIFCIVEFVKKTPNCPEVKCNSTEEKAEEVQAAPEEQEEAAGETPVEEEIDTKLSGKIEFSIKSATACIINETTDDARIDSIVLLINNGLNRKVSIMAKIYLWNDGASLNEQDDYLTKVEGITILSGATMDRSFDYLEEIPAGRFKEIDKEKKIQITLIDTDTEKEIGDKTISSVKATQLC